MCSHLTASCSSTVRLISIVSYLQIDVDIGSSSVARGVISLVLGYVTSLVVDLAILIEVCIFPVISFTSIPSRCFNCQTSKKN